MDRDFNLRSYAWAFTAASWGWTCRGRWSEAIAEARTAISAAEELSDDSVASFGLWIECIAYASQGDMSAALDSGRRAVGKAPTPADKVWSQSFLAWAMCRAGEPDRGVELLASVLPLYRCVSAKATGWPASTRRPGRR